jgi:4-azaleucine resistance transporter AzlC
VAAEHAVKVDAANFRAEVRRGVGAVAPLWPGVIPFAAVFAVGARAAGFGALETLALSTIVFAGSAQLTVITLTVAGASGVAIVLATLLLNLRHVLYGLSLAAHLGRRGRVPRGVLAFLLTDESYGMTIRAVREGRGGDALCLGAGLGIYVPFAAATLAGTVLGAALPDPAALGLDLVFSLSFLALLLPLLRSRLELVVALGGAGLALVLGPTLGGTAVMLATIGAAAGGVALEQRVGRG